MKTKNGRSNLLCHIGEVRRNAPFHKQQLGAIVRWNMIMKKIEAVCRQSKLQNVKDALVQIGVEGMTVTEVVGRGHKRGAILQYRGVTSEQAFVPNVKIETVVANNEAEAVIDAIFQSAHTGETGDGRIIVTEIESVLRIRTGEVDDTDADFVRHRSESNALPPVCNRVGSSLFASSR
jgi:nitrogen regulatory protein P-II 1